MLAWSTLAISLVALCVSCFALLVSREQLIEAITSNGGRGMNCSLQMLTPELVDALSEEQRSELKRALSLAESSTTQPGTWFLFSWSISGPGEYYEVTPYSWGDAGTPAGLIGAEPGKRMNCDSEERRIAFHIEDCLVDTIKIGVIWQQPYLHGLQPRGIRLGIDQPFECWIPYRGLSRQFHRSALGKWKQLKRPRPMISPMTQPWEYPTRRRAYHLRKRS